MNLRLRAIAFAVRKSWPRPRQRTPLEEAALMAEALLVQRIVTRRSAA